MLFNILLSRLSPYIHRRIFGLKRDEVMGGWRKLHNEELQYVTRLEVSLALSGLGG
jgi:hypothetical protein